MAILDRIKRWFFIPADSKPRHYGWKPSPSTPSNSKWSVIVRDTLKSPVPWAFGTRFFRAGSWHPHSESDRATLQQFVKSVAAEFASLPKPLWAEHLSEGEYDSLRLCLCCDIRLRDFSAEAFEDPAVKLAIVELALRKQRKILAMSPVVEGRLREPIRDYDFESLTAHGVSFEICWYHRTDSLSELDGDMLRPVPDAEPKKLKEHLTEVLDLARSLLPPAPLLDLATLPPVPKPARGRPAAVRRLDSSNLDRHFQDLDHALGPIFDFAANVFQTWLDDFVGQAFPELEDNKRMVAETMRRIDRYGFHVFTERNGEMLEVRIDARGSYVATKTNPESTAAKAGVFALRTYVPETGRSQSIGEVSTFPQLVAALDKDDARRKWEAKKGSGGNSVADSSTPLGE